MAELLASGIQVQEVPPRIRTLPPLPTAVLGMVGIAERGPIGVATRALSYEEYVNLFGGFTAASEMPLQIRQFFLLGGTEAWITRTVHYSDIVAGTIDTAAVGTLTLQTAATAATAGTVTGTVSAPFNLTPADTIDGDVDGLASQTATFNATAGTVTSGNVETYDLADGLTLTIDVDNTGVQTVTFNTAEFVDIGNATASEVAAVINAETTGMSATSPGTSVILTSDSLGTASEIDVTGGTANTGGVNRLGFATGPNNGTGNVADIDSVTFTEVKTVIEAALTNSSGVTVSQEGGGEVTITSNTTGTGSSIIVNAVSTADDEMGFDNATHSGTSGAAQNTLRIDGKTEGAYANNLTIDVETATSAVAGEFNLIVNVSAVEREKFVNLDITTAVAALSDANTGSNLIAGVDQGATGTTAQRRPADIAAAALTGGNDGLTSLADSDFIGDSASDTGIRAFDLVPSLTLLAIPDRATVSTQNAMITYAEVTRNHSVFAILDPPAGNSSSAIETHRDTLSPGSSEDAALYWPRIQIPNPSTTIFGTGTALTTAVSGSIAGVYAFNDGKFQEGAFGQPAGVELPGGTLAGVIGLETIEVLKESVRKVIFPKRINPIVEQPTRGRFLDGARTLKGDGNFPSIGERRGVSDIERVLKNGLEFARNKNNTPELRSSVEKTVRLELIRRMNLRSFASTDPATAFFVDVSDKLNNAAVVASRQLKVRIGLATNKPAEFIILLVTQDTRALDELAAAT